MEQSTGVQLTFRDNELRADVFTRRSWDGLSVESFQMHSARCFDYDWQGSECYLALHDIDLVDGEVAVGDHSSQRSDLRNRLTFIPPEVRVSGWSQLAGPNQGYTAIFFDPDLVEMELERPMLDVTQRPLLYFEHAQLGQTLRRINRLINVAQEDDPIKAETLGLLAVLQLYPELGLPIQPGKGQLSFVQQHQIREFIEAHLDCAITLSDLSAVAGLSRYHFARSFARTYGKPPHQYVLMRRIGLAASFLASTDLSVAETSARVGFSSPARLSTAFRRMTGRTPRQFRKAVR